MQEAFEAHAPRHSFSEIGWNSRKKGLVHRGNRKEVGQRVFTFSLAWVCHKINRNVRREWLLTCYPFYDLLCTELQLFLQSKVFGCILNIAVVSL